MVAFTQDSCIVLVQNRETDPKDVLRHHIEEFFQAKGFGIQTIVLQTRDSSLDRPPHLKPDLVVVLGGDGSFLRAVKCFAHDDVPLVGVNTGHLGFLTRIEADKVDTYLEAIVNGEAIEEDRIMLAVNNEDQLALNDVVVKNANPSRLAKISVYIDDEMLANYDADGIIVCTPTGSTAYNVSAGGPIIEPNAGVLAITAICPHSLAAKPIVVPDSHRLTLVADLSNHSGLVVALDGDDVFTIPPGDKITLFRSKHCVPLLTFKDERQSFFSILKRKLAWGANPRATSRIEPQRSGP